MNIHGGSICDGFKLETSQTSSVGKLMNNRHIIYRSSSTNDGVTF